ncbi:DUF1289 domain-containing protein [bacterium]|nr:DUF1289 domain-containing protein [bacterium]
MPVQDVMDSQTTRPKSPCNGTCLVNDQGTCIGCYRTLSEIGRWGTADDAEQQAILVNCAARKRQSSTGLPCESDL